MTWFFSKKTIKDVKVNLTRDDLVKRGRILLIDDERPDLIDDLKQARFSVDYYPDIKKNDIHIIDNPIHDLIILDFGQVGQEFGPDEGLSLLKYIKRVNPTAVIYTYTSKALPTDHAEFYRLADGCLKKDAGIADSTEKIEQGLRKALSIENMWSGVLDIAKIEPGSKDDLELQHLYATSLQKPGKIQSLKSKYSELAISESATKIGTTILQKLIEIGIKSATGGP